MNEMIERVAKAIYEADDPWSSAFEWPNMGSEDQSADEYRRIARAAIEAMREPTDDMILAAMEADGTLVASSVPTHFAAMIDAARA